MCGIAGAVGSVELAEETCDEILAALAHRGPDGQRARTWPNAILLHTRLRIIDLSPAGDQPMANEDGTVWVVFNGEIYNHHALRRELEAHGHVFRGRSDTEVLPHLYEEHGTEMFARLRGMFSAAVLDLRARRLLLARDRFGIKPLFYAAGDDSLAFASEINALRRFPGVDLEVDVQALADFAALFTIPAPSTIHRGIRALRAGDVLDCRFGDDGGIDLATRPFHSFSIAPDEDLSLAEAVDRAEALLEQAVLNELESDVPLGALLSGGIDSSLVSLFGRRHTSGQFLTFNVRTPDPLYDETSAAQAVAAEIGSEHRVLEMDDRPGGWDDISALLHHAGQPFADTSLFAVDALSRAMREHVTVALSGDGGDEGFGGYGAYWRIVTINRLRRAPPELWLAAANVVSPLAKAHLVRPTLTRRLRDLARADESGVVQTLFTWLREGEHRELLLDPDGVEPPRRLFEPVWPRPAESSMTPLDRLAAQVLEVNIRLILPNQFLPKVDIASMRHSLEVRVPMLDEDLIDFGLTLPHRLRVKGQTGKLVLRRLAARHLPAAIVERSKQGFSVPVDRWVAPEFKSTVRDVLLDSGTPLTTYFDRDVFAPWVEGFCTDERVPGVSREGLYQRVIMLLSLDLALRDLVAARTS